MSKTNYYFATIVFDGNDYYACKDPDEGLRKLWECWCKDAEVTLEVFKKTVIDEYGIGNLGDMGIYLPTLPVTGTLGEIYYLVKCYRKRKWVKPDDLVDEDLLQRACENSGYQPEDVVTSGDVVEEKDE